MNALHSEPTRFSIITPSYKQLDFLSLAAASVRDQAPRGDSNSTFPITVEHIIQDPGSPGLDEFVKKHRATYDGENLYANSRNQSKDRYSLHVHREKDKGMYDAINMGFKKASGEILAYLNCDEQYLSGTLLKVAAFFEAHPKIDILFGDSILVDAEMNPLSYRRVVLPNRIHTRLMHLCTLSCSMFFRRRLIDEKFFFDTQWRAIGDAVWIDSLLRAGKVMATLPEPLATFTFTGSNLSEMSRGANSEHSRWARTQGAPSSYLRYPTVIHHRLLKLLAGAYRRRDVQYEVFKQGDLQKRVKFQTSNLGYSWPNRSGFLQE